MSGITEMEVDEGDSKPSAPKDTVVLHRNAVKVITSSNVRTITSVGQSRVSKITGLSFILTQTWLKYPSLDSSRCVVYSGIRFKAIRAASNKMEQD